MQFAWEGWEFFPRYRKDFFLRKKGDGAEVAFRKGLCRFAEQNGQYAAHLSAVVF